MFLRLLRTVPQILSPSLATSTSSDRFMRRSPFLPLATTAMPAISTLTPAGILTGFLPTLDICLVPILPSRPLKHLTKYLAADVLVTRFRVGKHATGRRQDGDAEAIVKSRK